MLEFLTSSLHSLIHPPHYLHSSILSYSCPFTPSSSSHPPAASFFAGINFVRIRNKGCTAVIFNFQLPPEWPHMATTDRRCSPESQRWVWAWRQLCRDPPAQDTRPHPSHSPSHSSQLIPATYVEPDKNKCIHKKPTWKRSTHKKCTYYLNNILKSKMCVLHVSIYFKFT